MNMSLLKLMNNKKKIMKQIDIMIVDGQGGGVGKFIIEAIRKKFPIGLFWE